MRLVSPRDQGMNILETIAKHKLKPTGVIQVGSHHGEEIPIWESLGIPHIHFEPVRANYTKMMRDFPSVMIYPVALGSEKSVKDMFCETVNGGQSCSLLAPKEHLKILPWVDFNSKEKVIVCELDDFNIEHCNMLYIDAQGYELEVLRGGVWTIDVVDYIITEVNRAEVFEGCARIDEIDEYMAHASLHRVETNWHGGDFGDALYVR